MSDDYKVNPRSDKDVRDIARRMKMFFGVQNSMRPVNIVRILEEAKSVQTQFGRKQLVYKPVADDSPELEGDDARTIFEPGTITILTKQSVHNRARMGVGRDRMTLAHELGHAVMHPGAPKSRVAGATGATSLSRTNAFESAEHQAKVFASAFLIHDEIAQNLSAEEIATEFLVSPTAADICRKRLDELAERLASIERVRELNERVQKSLAQQSPPPLVAPKPTPLTVSVQAPNETGMMCASCGHPTRVAVGTKFWCPNCPSVRDQFPDGDD